MVDDLRSLKDTILKSVFTVVAGDDEQGRASGVKEIISMLAGLAGKGKDEVVQMISREIGLAVAAALKEPMTKALKNRKVRVTIEFVPDSEEEPPRQEHQAPKNTAKRKPRST